MGDGRGGSFFGGDGGCRWGERGGWVKAVDIGGVWVVSDCFGGFAGGGLAIRDLNI